MVYIQRERDDDEHGDVMASDMPRFVATYMGNRCPCLANYKG